MVIGGRHLGAASDGDVEIELALEGIVIDRWRLTFAERNFLRFVTLRGIPPGEGDYGRLSVASRSLAPHAPAVPVAIRQFDIQPLSRVVWGFAEGWHEAESDFDAGLNWRWTSERSVVRLLHSPGAVRLKIRGESPLKYLDAAPSVTISVGAQKIAQFRPDADFAWDLMVPEDLLADTESVITIATDRVYVPSAVEGTTDERRLGLRILEWSVTAVR
jgi:hypothetical protein